MTTASAVVVFAASASAVTASAFVSVASATSAAVYELAVETFGQLLFCSFTYSEDFACEMEGLACHLVVEVHLDRICSDFENDSRNNTAHAVEHRDGVARHEKVLTDFAVDFECRLRKVDYHIRIHFSISFCRRECNVKFVPWLHAFDMGLELWEEAACSMDIVKRSFLCCLVDDLSVDFKVVAEFHYRVRSNLHMFM